MNERWVRTGGVIVGACVILAAMAGTPLDARAQATAAVRIVNPARTEPPDVEIEFDEPEPPPAPAAGTSPPSGAAVVTPPPKLSTQEIDELKSQFEALSPEEQAEMKAYYADLGLNLDEVLGLNAARSAEQAKLQELMSALKNLDFSRTPQAVLAARAQLGFGQVPQPNPQTARGGDIAKWAHLQAMAGEWGVFAEFIRSRPEAQSQAIFSHLLQSLNKGNPGLLPEEILAIAEASPGDLKTWQLPALSGLLKQAAEKNSPGPMLAKIKAGTRLFGPQDAERRRRTVDFLAGAGMVIEAYEYLPSLEEARAEQDGPLMMVHARYKEDLTRAMVSGPETEAARRDAWDLYCEVSLLPRATLSVKREAIRRAVALMDTMPRASVTPWLEQLFAGEAIGPVALEIMALSAVAIGNEKSDVEQRARAILSLKEAVDVLLARGSVDTAALRVPMRMLTTVLVSEIENTVKEKGQQRVMAREAQLLLRAVPDRRWFEALEPSLSTRASKACIAIALTADETDAALVLLNDAVARSPEQAVELADGFLSAWQLRLRPESDFDDDRMFFYFYREMIPSAPLTRGRQRRNLDRLSQLMRTLESTGVDPRTLPAVASAFQACHSRTEVFDRADIVRIFGDLGKIPASTCCALAETMAASLNGDWRNRAVQRTTGTKRTDSEIALLVDKGYGLALDLIDSAMASRRDSWKYASIKAGLAYDRMMFKQSQGPADAAKTNEYRQASFGAFEQAAEQYAKAVIAGEEREDIGVYLRWFGAAMGTAQLNFIRADDMPTEGGPPDDQIDRIRGSMNRLPPDSAFRHVGDFARTMAEAVTRSDPEVKPRLVKQALRIVGDHPGGAALRGMDELYRDLVREELKLRLTIDGPDSVGVGKPFAMLVSLRFTNSVDRETGGFAKYLQNNVFTRVGRDYREVNYRDQFQKAIEEALSKAFSIDTIGYFDPFMPARGVQEEGQDGWMEKPMAYLILTRKDPSVDRVPQVMLDMQFDDQTGPVTLVLPSNTPPIATGDSRESRPVQDLAVSQIIDVRDARDGIKDRSIKLEVQVRGKGMVPDIREVLAGLESPIAGYELAQDGIEAKPTLILQEGEVVSNRFYWGPPQPPKTGYPEPDADGMYRLPVERTWVVTYRPGAGAKGTAFAVPTLRAGMNAKLESRYYSDLDLVPVSGPVVFVQTSIFTPMRITIGIGLLVVGLGVGWLVHRRRRRVSAPSQSSLMPERLTPLSAVMALHRIREVRASVMQADEREALERDIRGIERAYFGPGGATNPNGDLAAVVGRWATTPVSARHD
ncbi:MAG: hypothetical protein JNK25_10755 [Phycisphaerae bacterium]|nr:hypothetical protein [Phycisphaerae bacterium]